MDKNGNVWISENSHRIRKITPEGEVSTIAGSKEGFGDGIGSHASFYFPNDIAIDNMGNLIVVDTDNCRIRKVTPQGMLQLIIFFHSIIYK